MPVSGRRRNAGFTAMSGRVEMAVVPPLCPVEVTPFDFSRTADLIRRAEASTRLWLRQGGLSRRRIPEELSTHTHGNG